MLKNAILYVDDLKKKMYETWYDEKYKYYNINPYNFQFDVSENTYEQNQFVSVNKNGKVIGYISYKLDRMANAVIELGVINFSDDKITFGKDLAQAIREIFLKFHFNKINFSVVVGNPIEKQYNKLIEKYGGRIVGIYYDDVKLFDGKLYDRQLYELLRKDFINSLEYINY